MLSTLYLLQSPPPSVTCSGFILDTEQKHGNIFSVNLSTRHLRISIIYLHVSALKQLPIWAGETKPIAHIKTEICKYINYLVIIRDF